MFKQFNENNSEKDQFFDNFNNNIRKLAIYHIDNFFKGKKLCSGGKIPKYMLHCEKRISMVMNYDIIKGIDHAYDVLKYMVSSEEEERSYLTGEVTEDIKLVTKILNLLSKSDVPQQFAGGMMILYLEFVEGVRCNRT